MAVHDIKSFLMGEDLLDEMNSSVCEFSNQEALMELLEETGQDSLWVWIPRNRAYRRWRNGELFQGTTVVCWDDWTPLSHSVLERLNFKWWLLFNFCLPTNTSSCNNMPTGFWRCFKDLTQAFVAVTQGTAFPVMLWALRIFNRVWIHRTAAFDAHTLTYYFL